MVLCRKTYIPTLIFWKSSMLANWAFFISTFGGEGEGEEEGGRA